MFVGKDAAGVDSAARSLSLLLPWLRCDLLVTLKVTEAIGIDGERMTLSSY